MTARPNLPLFRQLALLATTMIAVAGMTACSGQSGGSISKSEAVIDGFTCKDTFPGVPSGGTHTLSVQGSVSNGGTDPIENAVMEIRIASKDGRSVFTVNVSDPRVLNVPGESPVPFSTSTTLGAQMPALDGAACSVSVVRGADQIPVSGTAHVEVTTFYAP